MKKTGVADGTRHPSSADILAESTRAAARRIATKLVDDVQSRLQRNPRTGRPSEPEGFAVAMRRFQRNVWLIRNGVGMWPGNGPVKRAWADLSHSWANVHVEWCREAGMPWPKVLGKGAVALEIGALVALMAWPVLLVV